MIDHLLGRPSVSWKRTQVFLVIFFWLSRLVTGSRGGPRLLWIRRINRSLAHYSPWQIILSTLTFVYAIRHVDNIFGIAAPEPLARLYSRSYYRATWIATGLDAGFATAMAIQPKWLRDICSIIFSAYYIIYANEADEKLRKHRAVCTVEMLRATWEKTANPYIRALTYFDRPSIDVVRRILLPRPDDSPHTKPISAWLYFARPERQLAQCTDLILDFPGGGFICMGPKFHEERLRRWAIVSGKPVLAIDYGKAPEYPYPWAIEECFDVYRVLAESKGRAIGMAGSDFNVVLTGDSAGANVVCNVMFKILEHPKSLIRPVALVLSYAALDFNFSSWMKDENMRVLQTEQSSSNIAGLVEQKNHFAHKSPLSVVKDVGERKPRRRTWGKALGLVGESTKSGGRTTRDHTRSSSTSRNVSPDSLRTPRPLIRSKTSIGALRQQLSQHAPSASSFSTSSFTTNHHHAVDGNYADAESEEEDDYYPLEEKDKPIAQRVVYSGPNVAENVRMKQAELEEEMEEAEVKAANAKKAPIGTRLTMTSRTGFFQDRIISPSMMRAMAILYIGPRQNPNFETDYCISPILAPARLLVDFPPLLMVSGEKDPFVDDTVIFAGKVRQAKRARKAELERQTAGRSAKFGESLRMTMSSASGMDSKKMEKLLNESEEEWVQMEIFEGWSHGFLLMPTLLHEARAAIDNMAEWIDEALVTYGVHAPPATATGRRGSSMGSDTPTGVRSGKGKAGATPSSNTASETEGDEMLTLVPKRKRSPPNSVSNVRPIVKDDITESPMSLASSPAATTLPLLTGPATPPVSPKHNGRSVAIASPPSPTTSAATTPSTTHISGIASSSSLDTSATLVSASRLPPGVKMVSQSPPGVKGVPEAMLVPVGADRRGATGVPSVAEAASVTAAPGAGSPGASLLPGIATPKGPTNVLKSKLDEAELMRRRRAEAVLGMGEIAEAA